jgi:predicted aspartyl protease
MINGRTKVAAIADTGAARNIISYEYAAGLGLDISRCSSSFKLANSREIKSIGKLITILSAKINN